MTVEISQNLLIIPIVASLWNLVLMFVMTALNENSSSPSCPPIPIHTTRGKAIITVINRSAELFLIDNDITTCLMVFDQGWRFFYMITYIYVPVCIPHLHVILDTSGLHQPGIDRLSPNFKRRGSQWTPLSGMRPYRDKRHWWPHAAVRVLMLWSLPWCLDGDCRCPGWEII